MYQVTFDVVSITAGEIIAFLGGSQGTTRTLADTYTENFTATNSNFWLRASADFIGSIDNVSVKEYISADMDVTRATAATRVDENGLVNYAEVIGDDLVTCGDFSCATPSTYWTATNAVISFANNQLTVESVKDKDIKEVDENDGVLFKGISKSCLLYTSDAADE